MGSPKSGRWAATTNQKTTSVLNSLLDGGSYTEIAKRAGTSAAHAFKIANEFPLWKWASGHEELPDD